MKLISNSSILTTLFLILFIGVGNSFVIDNQAPTISKTFTLTGPGSLNIETSGGGIAVRGHEERTVVVKAFIKKSGRLLSPDHELVTRLNEGYELTIKQGGNEINITAKQIKNLKSWRNLSVSFEIAVPYEMASTLKTSGAGIKISDVQGNQKLITSGGRIMIQNINGKVIGKTSGGGIHVKGNKGDIDISTSGGRIVVVNSYGHVKARTSGGGIKLESVDGNADVSTSGGSIELSGEMHHVTARTTGGSISANITGVTEKLYLVTSGGSIDATIPSDLNMDLDLKGNHVNIQLKNFDGSVKKHEVIGSMNSGGIHAYMRTSGGSVNVNFQSF